MTVFFRPLLSSAALCLAATAASADLRAEDVWTDWQTYIESFGYTVDGQQQRSGNQLVISGVTMQYDDEAGTGGATIAMDRIVMTETAQGTVDIDLPAVMPMIFTSPDAQGRTSRISMDYRQSGLDIVATGTAEALDYTYAADTISLVSTGMEVDGTLLPPESNLIELSLDGLRGTSQSLRDTAYRYAQDIQVAALRYRVLTRDDASATRSEISGQTQALTFVGASTLPFETGATSSMTDMLDAGLSTNGTFRYATNATTLLVTNPDGTSEAALISQDGSIGVTMAGTGLSYEARQNDTQLEINAAQMGLPLSFGIGQAGLTLAMPLRKTDTAEDFAFGLTLSDFSASDVLWGIFDPGAQLPRDPATVAIALAGKARLLMDFLDPADMAGLSPDTPPVDVDNVIIRQLLVSALGAELTGNGAFEFDDSATGAPQPRGAVDLTLRGGNALIDRLIATGLLPQEQAMGMRMMLGLLAVPGDAPDTLNSRIEINDQGHVIANGQRIQ